MGILAVAADERVADVSFDQDALSVRLKDGRTISVPLAWYPRLFHATTEQRRNWKVAGGGYGIHWPEIDEDISTEGLLRGAPAPVPTQEVTACESVAPLPPFRKGREGMGHPTGVTRLRAILSSRPRASALAEGSAVEPRITHLRCPG